LARAQQRTSTALVGFAALAQLLARRFAKRPWPERHESGAAVPATSTGKFYTSKLRELLAAKSCGLRGKAQ